MQTFYADLKLYIFFVNVLKLFEMSYVRVNSEKVIISQILIFSTLLFLILLGDFSLYTITHLESKKNPLLLIFW